MRVLLFTLEYPPFYGGVANYYGNLVKHWPWPDDIFVLHNNNGRLINNKLPFPKWLPAFFYLWRDLKKYKIHHIMVGHILPLGTVVYLVSLITKTSYSIFLHGMDFTLALKSKRKKWLAKNILKKAQSIICINSYVARLVQEEWADYGKKITVVNPGIDIKHITHNIKHITKIKEKYNLSNKLILLTVGRLVKRKGVDKVLASLPAVLKEAPDLKYVIVGIGEEEKNFNFLISNLKLEKNTLLLTNVNDAEKNAWFDLCDIFIMPARDIAGDFEGFGIVYLEANLRNKPVIAGDSGGVRDAIIDGVNGLLINPENTEEISSAVIKLARDENLRKKLGEQGKARALKEFNWEKQVRTIYDIIK